MDITMPDGTVVEGVPDNMSKADFVSKAKANGAWKPEWDVAKAEDKKDKGFLGKALDPLTHIPSDIAEEFNAGGNMAREAVEERRSESLLSPVLMPILMSPGSLKYLAGGVRQVMSPLSGTVKSLWERPFEESVPEGVPGKEFVKELGSLALNLFGPGAVTKAASAIPSAVSGVGRVPGLIGKGMKGYMGVTPAGAALAKEAAAEGVALPLKYATPGAKTLAYEQDQAGQIFLDPNVREKNKFIERRIQRLYEQSGLSRSETDAAVKETMNPTAAPSASAAAEAIGGAARRNVAAITKEMQTSLSTAKEHTENMGRYLEESMAPTQATGQLARDLESAIETERSGFSAAMSRAYGDVHEMFGGDPVVPTGPIISAANKVAETIPPANQPKIISQLSSGQFPRTESTRLPPSINQEGIIVPGKVVQAPAETITIQDAHDLRSKFRELARNSQGTSLTPGLSYHEYEDMAQAIDEAIAGVPVEYGDAAKALKETDRSYREGIAKYKNATIRQLVSQMKSGLAPDAEKVASAVFRDGTTETANEIMTMAPPQVRGQLSNAYIRSIIKDSSSIDEAGNLSVQGKRLLSVLESNDPMLRVAFMDSPEGLGTLKRYAKELAAIDGHVEVGSLEPGTVASSLRNAAKQSEELRAVAESAPFKSFLSADPKVREAGIRALLSNDVALEDAFEVLGDNEKNLVRDYALKSTMSNAIHTDPAGNIHVTAKGFNDAWKAYSSRQQELLFPGGMKSGMKNLGLRMEALFPRSSADPGTSLHAAAVKSGVPTKRSAVVGWTKSKFYSWLLNKPEVVRFLVGEYGSGSPDRIALADRMTGKLLEISPLGLVGAVGRALSPEKERPGEPKPTNVKAQSGAASTTDQIVNSIYGKTP